MMSPLETQLIRRFSGSAPRYTSYPTAPHFHAGVTDTTYAKWLNSLESDDAVSLYVHVPFCGTLCWFCACRSQGARVYGPVTRYLSTLAAEIEAVGSIVAGRPVKSVHWGGGSPTILEPEDLRALNAELRRHFNILDDAEFAVEIDARDMTEGRLDALGEIGVTRASVGVQDFAEDVQKAINRRQSFEKTAAVIGGLRRRGVSSVNIDALYGLPLQTRESVAQTIEQVVQLSPDRAALFGYAHVPWMARRQQLIREETLPSPEERFAQAKIAAAGLEAAGYQRVGLDHFAKPDDSLAEAARSGALRRNFQGYTTDGASTLVGLGASAISRTRWGYAQNAGATADYQNRVAAGGMAIARGVAMTPEDRARADAIERLMCDLEFDGLELARRHGDHAVSAQRDAARALASMPPGLLERTEHGFRVKEVGRPFVRNIATYFDAYLESGQARYSRAV